MTTDLTRDLDERLADLLKRVTDWLLFAESKNTGVVGLISTVLGLWGGYVLDRWLGSAPWLMLVGLLLGIASGFVNLFRAAGIFGREGGQADRDRSD